MIEEIPLEPEGELSHTPPHEAPEPEQEPEPEPPKAKPPAKPKAEAKKAPGRPKKAPGAPKANYTPRKPAPKDTPRDIPKEPPPEPPQPPPSIDEQAVARQVVGHIGQFARNRFEARREDWRDMIASNYR